MKRVMFFVMLICMTQFGVWMAHGATLSWAPVTTYTDDTDIGPTELLNVRYHPFTGPSAAGPWTEYTEVSALSVTVPDPAGPGATLWYSVEASLYGVRSEKAAAVPKSVPFPQVDAPQSLQVN